MQDYKSLFTINVVLHYFMFSLSGSRTSETCNSTYKRNSVIESEVLKILKQTKELELETRVKNKQRALKLNIICTKHIYTLSKNMKKDHLNDCPTDEK